MHDSGEDILLTAYDLDSGFVGILIELLGKFVAAVVVEIGRVDIEDKLTVSRARKIQRFLSQPFFVAGQFTGLEGRYVPLSETIQGFKEILEGKHDDIPEQYFLNAGNIDDVLARVK